MNLIRDPKLQLPIEHLHSSSSNNFDHHHHLSSIPNSTTSNSTTSSPPKLIPHKLRWASHTISNCHPTRLQSQLITTNDQPSPSCSSLPSRSISLGPSSALENHRLSQQQKQPQRLHYHHHQSHPSLVIDEQPFQSLRSIVERPNSLPSGRSSFSQPSPPQPSSHRIISSRHSQPLTSSSSRLSTPSSVVGFVGLLTKKLRPKLSTRRPSTANNLNQPDPHRSSSTNPKSPTNLQRNLSTSSGPSGSIDHRDRSSSYPFHDLNSKIPINHSSQYSEPPNPVPRLSEHEILELHRHTFVRPKPTPKPRLRVIGQSSDLDSTPDPSDHELKLDHDHLPRDKPLIRPERSGEDSDDGSKTLSSPSISLRSHDFDHDPAQARYELPALPPPISPFESELLSVRDDRNDELVHRPSSSSPRDKGKAPMIRRSSDNLVPDIRLNTNLRHQFEMLNNLQDHADQMEKLGGPVVPSSALDSTISSTNSHPGIFTLDSSQPLETPLTQVSVKTNRTFSSDDDESETEGGPRTAHAYVSSSDLKSPTRHDDVGSTTSPRVRTKPTAHQPHLHQRTLSSTSSTRGDPSMIVNPLLRSIDRTTMTTTRPSSHQAIVPTHPKHVTPWDYQDLCIQGSDGRIREVIEPNSGRDWKSKMITTPPETSDRTRSSWLTKTSEQSSPSSSRYRAGFTISNFGNSTSTFGRWTPNRDSESEGKVKDKGKGKGRAKSKSRPISRILNLEPPHLNTWSDDRQVQHQDTEVIDPKHDPKGPSTRIDSQQILGGGEEEDSNRLSDEKMFLHINESVSSSSSSYGIGGSISKRVRSSKLYRWSFSAPQSLTDLQPTTTSNLIARSSSPRLSSIPLSTRSSQSFSNVIERNKMSEQVVEGSRALMNDDRRSGSISIPKQKSSDLDRVMVRVPLQLPPLKDLELGNRVESGGGEGQDSMRVNRSSLGRLMTSSLFLDPPYPSLSRSQSDSLGRPPMMEKKRSNSGSSSRLTKMMLKRSQSSTNVLGSCSSSTVSGTLNLGGTTRGDVIRNHDLLVKESNSGGGGGTVQVRSGGRPQTAHTIGRSGSRGLVGGGGSGGDQVGQVVKQATGQDFKLKHLPRLNEDEPEEAYLERLSKRIEKSMIVSILAASSDPFHNSSMVTYLDSFEFAHDPIDLALRKLLFSISLPKETQQIDRVMEAFSKRYVNCNPKLYSSSDQVYVLAFSIIMLHTDAFNKHNRAKMSRADYVKNTRMEGIPNEVLEYIYDNVTYTQFVYADEDRDMTGNKIENGDSNSEKPSSFFHLGTSTNSHHGNTSVGLSGTVGGVVSSGTTNSRSDKHKIDPYVLIAKGLTHELRPEIESMIPSRNPFSYTGSVRYFDSNRLRRSFGSAPTLQIVNVGTSSKSNWMMNKLIAEVPNEPEHEDLPVGTVMNLRAVKVGLMFRKDEVGSDRSIKNVTTRKWREWCVVLTGSQLMFMKDTTLVDELQQSFFEAVRRNVEGQQEEELVVRITGLKPDSVLSLEDGIALMDLTYTRRLNTFRLILDKGGHQYLMEVADEEEMNSWITHINYAATFRTSRVPFRKWDTSDQTGLLSNSTSSYTSRVGESRTSTSSSMCTPSGIVDVDPIGREQASPHVGDEDQALTPMAKSTALPNSARYESIQGKIKALEKDILKAKTELNEDLRVARNLAVLTPFQVSTRLRLQQGIIPIADRIREARYELSRLVCYREILVRDHALDKATAIHLTEPQSRVNDQSLEIERGDQNVTGMNPNRSPGELIEELPGMSSITESSSNPSSTPITFERSTSSSIIDQPTNPLTEPSSKSFDRPLPQPLIEGSISLNLDTQASRLAGSSSKAPNPRTSSIPADEPVKTDDHQNAGDSITDEPSTPSSSSLRDSSRRQTLMPVIVKNLDHQDVGNGQESKSDRPSPSSSSSRDPNHRRTLMTTRELRLKTGVISPTKVSSSKPSRLVADTNLRTPLTSPNTESYTGRSPIGSSSSPGDFKSPASEPKSPNLNLLPISPRSTCRPGSSCSSPRSSNSNSGSRSMISGIRRSQPNPMIDPRMRSGDQNQTRLRADRPSTANRGSNVDDHMSIGAHTVPSTVNLIPNPNRKFTRAWGLP